MTLEQRLDELFPRIDYGLIERMEVNKRINLTALYQKNRHAQRFYWTVDFYYKEWLSKYPKTKPIIVVEFFNKPEFYEAYQIKRDIFLKKSRNVRVVEHWHYQTLKGMAKSRHKYKTIGVRR